MHKIIRLPDVIKSTGLKRSTIYLKIANECFPRQIYLGAKSVGWLEVEIQNWIQDRINAS